MAKARTSMWGLLIPVLLNFCLYLDFAYSENAGFPNLQSSQEVSNTQNILQGPCESLFSALKDLKKTCQALQLKKVLGVSNLKIDDWVNLVMAIQGPLRTFTNPEEFQKIAEDSESFSRRMGFDGGMKQLLTAEVGPAFVVKTVPFVKLANFTDADDPEKFFRETGQVGLPLNVEVEGRGKQGKSMWMFELFQEQNNEWKWTERGFPDYLKEFFKYRKNDQPLMVVMRPINMRFLGEKINGELVLIPLRDAEFGKTKLKAGEPDSAKKIFGLLAKVAREIVEENNKIKQEGKRIPAG